MRRWGTELWGLGCEGVPVAHARIGGFSTSLAHRVGWLRTGSPIQGKRDLHSAHLSLGITKKPLLVSLRVERWPHSTQEETAEAFGEACGHPSPRAATLELLSFGLSEQLQTATRVPAAAPGPTQAGEPLGLWAPSCGCSGLAAWPVVGGEHWVSIEDEGLSLLGKIPPQDRKLLSVLGY